jgi:hypothetical protein
MFLVNFLVKLVPGVAYENPMITLGLSFHNVSHKKLYFLVLICSRKRRLLLSNRCVLTHRVHSFLQDIYSLGLRRIKDEAFAWCGIVSLCFGLPYCFGADDILGHCSSFRQVLVASIL